MVAFLVADNFSFDVRVECHQCLTGGLLQWESITRVCCSKIDRNNRGYATSPAFLEVARSFECARHNETHCFVNWVGFPIEPQGEVKDVAKMTGGQHSALRPLEIGRASCRGREQISVVAVSLK